MTKSLYWKNHNVRSDYLLVFFILVAVLRFPPAAVKLARPFSQLPGPCLRVVPSVFQKMSCQFCKIAA
jgi:hypothetical protein